MNLPLDKYLHVKRMLFLAIFHNLGFTISIHSDYLYFIDFNLEFLVFTPT